MIDQRIGENTYKNTRQETFYEMKDVFVYRHMKIKCLKICLLKDSKGYLNMVKVR